MFETGTVTSCEYPLHVGDLASGQEGRVAITGIGPENENIRYYDFNKSRSDWMHKHDFHVLWDQIRYGEGGTMWVSIGRDTRDIISPETTERYFIQAHRVIMRETPKDHPKKSYVLSWAALDSHQFPFPTDMQFVKYRDIVELHSDIQLSVKGEKLERLSNWLDSHEEVELMVRQFPAKLKRRFETTHEELEWVWENDDQVIELMKENGIIDENQNITSYS